MKTFNEYIEQQERVEQISIEDFPFELDDIISCETKYLGPCDTPENIAHVKQVRDSAQITRIEKVFGYGSDFKKSSNSDDFFYQVTIKYTEKASDEMSDERLRNAPYFSKPGERTYENNMLIGVNQEGKAAVFAS